MNSTATHNHGRWIDYAFIALSLLVLPRIGNLIQRLFAGSFQDNEPAFLAVTFLIITTSLWRWVSLYLKRFALAKRKDKNAGAFGLIWLFQLPTSILGMAFLVLAVVVVMGIVMPADTSEIAIHTEGDAFLGIMGFSILAIESYLLYLYTSDRTLKIDDWRSSTLAEIFADSGFFASMFVWMSFYNFVVAAISEHALASVINFVGIFILAVILFVFFYLGPRMVLLSEDGGTTGTWFRMALVFLISFAMNVFWY